jgi:hypothetical protein
LVVVVFPKNSGIKTRLLTAKSLLFGKRLAIGWVGIGWVGIGWVGIGWVGIGWLFVGWLV